jgi:MYXO-CTERM domain-containing protein
VTLVALQSPADQLPKELIFIPALALLALVAGLQGRRRKQEGALA